MGIISRFTGQQKLREQIAALRGDMFRLAYSWCHQANLADDLVQDAMARGLAKLDQLRDPQGLKPWMFRILVNVWRDHLRRQKPDDDIDNYVISDGDSPEQHWTRQTVQDRVRAAVSKLPQGQRLVVSLVDLQDASYAEAAEILGVPIGTIMSRLCRARRTLAERLREQEIPSVTPLHAKRSER